jgi:hypothetical protein
MEVFQDQKLCSAKRDMSGGDPFSQLVTGGLILAHPNIGIIEQGRVDSRNPVSDSRKRSW